MKNNNISSVYNFVEQKIDSEFYSNKKKKIQDITLEKILKRKNPYLFKAKGNDTAHDFIKSVLDAAVSSGEETTFGNFLEKIAIFVCEETYCGRKSSATGLDLEFEDGNKKYLVSIKSGPNWGNSSQISKLKSNFIEAKKKLHTSGGGAHYEIICVEGCCYGVDNKPYKGTHYKYCGQRFWELISNGNAELYLQLIVPLGQSAKIRNDEINALITQKQNLLTHQFLEKFCVEGLIDWEKLVRFISGKSNST